MKKFNINKTVIINLLIAILSVAVVGIIGRFLTNADSQWFLSLAKPSQFISPVVFPIVWSVIYVAFAVVIYLLLKNNDMSKEITTLLIINGVLQLVWSLVYFRLHSIIGGLVIITLVLASAVYLISLLYKKKPCYFYILLIYPLWLFLATFANAAVWILN